MQSDTMSKHLTVSELQERLRAAGIETTSKNRAQLLRQLESVRSSERRQAKRDREPDPEQGWLALQQSS